MYELNPENLGPLSNTRLATLIGAGLDVSEQADKPLVCIRCRQQEQGTRVRRMNTAYVDDALNYTVECDSCFDLTVEEFNDLWQLVRG